MTQLSRFALAALPALLVATPVLAHTGVGATHSFSAGLAHPLLGWDHLLAMLAVGLWAGLAGGRALWAWPVAFVVFMAAGGGLGLAGLSLPAMEGVIAASVVALGLAIALQLKPQAALGAAIVAGFALFHGNAHGLEAPAAGGLAYAAGFTLATAGLHGLGLAIAVLARRLTLSRVLRFAGLGIAVAGMTLAAA